MFESGKYIIMPTIYGSAKIQLRYKHKIFLAPKFRNSVSAHVGLRLILSIFKLISITSRLSTQRVAYMRVWMRLNDK